MGRKPPGARNVTALRLFLGCCLAAGAASSTLAADDEAIADFYRGKQLRIVIRAEPGGNYDIYSRLLGRYITRHIPGNPTVVPVNMPGGGGMTALNYVANVAPRDGTVISMITQSLPLEQALRLNPSLKADLRQLQCIGNMSSDNEFLFTAPASPTRTLDDARRRQTLIAATGMASVSTYITAVANNMLGTKFRVLYGYPSGPAMNMAMARGEAEGRTTSNPDSAFLGVEAAAFHYILQVGLKKDHAFPDVPLLNDLATGPDEKLVFGFLSSVVALSRPVCSTSEVPAERVAALRAAFAKAMADPDLLAEAERLKLPVSFTGGAEVQDIVARIVDAPAADIDKVREAIRLKPADAIEGKAAP